LRLRRQNRFATDNSAPFSSLDGKWKCCGNALPAQTLQNTQQTQRNHTEMTESHSQTTPRRTARVLSSSALRLTSQVDNLSAVSFRIFRARRVSPRILLKFAPELTIPNTDDAPHRQLHPCKKRNLVEKKPESDKRNALRTNFQLKTRGQKMTNKYKKGIDLQIHFCFHFPFGRRFLLSSGKLKNAKTKKHTHKETKRLSHCCDTCF
jgi:hypothetical protein